MSSDILSKPTVLVIDDEPPTLKFIEIALVNAGFQVVKAKDSFEGLKQLQSKPIDAVIVEDILEGMSGFEFTRAIKRNPLYKAIPVLMTSRKSDRASVRQAIECGISDYIIKPLDERLLVDKLQLALQKNQHTKNVPELILGEMEQPCDIFVNTTITAISESDLTISSPIPLNENSRARIDTQIFQIIGGVARPMMRFASCEEDRIAASEGRKSFKIRFSLIGLTDEERQKIRQWIFRHQVRRSRDSAQTS